MSLHFHNFLWIPNEVHTYIQHPIFATRLEAWTDDLTVFSFYLISPVIFKINLLIQLMIHDSSNFPFFVYIAHK